MNESEHLRDMITVLELARNREKTLRRESEYILEALQILNNESIPETMLARSTSILQKALNFEEAFVINQTEQSHWIGQDITGTRFNGTRWNSGSMMQRVVHGETVPVYDITRVPEWSEQPPEVRNGVQSALHIPLRGLQSVVMLVCTHSERGVFQQKHSNLASRFAALTSQIFKNIEYQNEILERNAAMEKDLQTARVIQNTLVGLPVPEVRGLKSAYQYKPLEAIGGDYFNLIPLENGGMGVFVGDVSGHGVSAALFLSLLKFNTDRVGRNHSLEPAKYLCKLNDSLYGHLVRSFLTGIYGVFQPVSGAMRFTMAKGGHPAPIYYNAREKSGKFLHSNGPLLGVFTKIEVDEIEINLSRGDRIFFYTDGLTEIRTSAGNLLGENELLQIFKESQKPKIKDTVAAILNEILRRKSNHTPDDDIVLIGVEFVGRSRLFGF